jgi:(2Fe-2S) ferredoxin
MLRKKHSNWCSKTIDLWVSKPIFKLTTNEVELRRKAAMQKPDIHIFVCASFRGTEAKGKCIKKGSMQLINYLEEELVDRGMNAIVSSTGCLKVCEEGPIMVVYPQAHWYGGVTDEAAIDEILDALENGKAAEGRLL